jgi:predicted RND superfamily exporter protein
MNHFVGAKYNTVSYGQLVQAIRKDLKSLKNADFIVKKHLFPGGMSITIILRKVAQDIPIWNENADEKMKEDIEKFKNFIETYGCINFPYHSYYYTYFSNKINELMKQAKDIALAYNREDSDPMTDYFSTNFNIYMEIELKK